VFEVLNGREQAKLGHAGRYVNATFCGPEPTLICSGWDSREVRLWSSKTGETTARHLEDHARFQAAATGLHGAAVNTESLRWLLLPGLKSVWTRSFPSRWGTVLAISPDASVLATNDGWSKGLVVLDTGDGHQRTVFTGHAAPPQKLAFSPDATMIASAGEDWRLIVGSLKSEDAICRFRARDARFNAVVFSADSKSLFVSPEHGLIAAYSVPEGTPRFGIKCPGNWVQAAVCSAAVAASRETNHERQV
jgi:WD40 repeat protein